MTRDREIAISVPAFGEVVDFARMEGFDEMSRPFAFAATLFSDNMDLKAADVLGTPATITVTGTANGTAARHFNGLVADFGLTEIRAGRAFYRLTLRPWLWFLWLTTDNRIFQQKSVVEILDAVFADHPEARVDKRLRASYPPRDYCVQYGESDLDFVQRLMESEGIFYFFEHADGEHRLVLADGNAAMEPGPHSAALPYESDSRISFHDGDFITAWRPRASVRPGAFTQTDYDFEKPASDLTARSDARLGHALDRAEAYAYPGRYTLQARGDRLARLRLEELQADFERVEATATARHLWSGRRFRLEHFPREAENEDHLVLRVDYRLWDERALSGQGGEPLGYEVALLLAPARRAFRPGRRTPRPVMKGPQTAVVVGPAGAEIFTDSHARVKVQFPWDREGKRDENTTCFVRVSQAWAGAGWGFIQIPRIGQEVIVDFLEGDPDQPIITGRVYNASQMPPYGLPGSASQSGWKSNSTPGGGGWNELRFEDKAGAEEVYFQAQKDHNELIKNNESRSIGNDFAEDIGNDATQSVGHDRSESVKNDKSVTVGNNRTVGIGADDSETVGANRSLHVVADETIAVDGSSSETIGVNHTQKVGLLQSITVGAARVDHVTAAETRSVGGVQSNTIGASRSVSVTAGQTHKVGGDDGWQVDGKQGVKVAGDQGVSVGGGQSVSVGKDLALSVTGGRTTSVGKDDAVSATGAISMSAGKTIVLKATDAITLTCGSASLTLKSDGTISVNGKDIMMKGSGGISVKASSEVLIKGSKVNNN